MNEPVLYQHCKHEEQPMEAEADLCNKCLPWLGFVPVERCEHGNIDGHWVPSDPGRGLTGPVARMIAGEATGSVWCPGAGIGETDEA